MKTKMIALNGKRWEVSEGNYNIDVYFGHAVLKNVASGDDEKEVKKELLEFARENRFELLIERVEQLVIENDYEYDELELRYFNENSLSSLCCDLLDGDYAIVEWQGGDN